MATAQRLAEAGLDLILLARRKDRLASLRDDLTVKYGVKIDALTADVRNFEDLERQLQTVDLTSVDVLVNNAGLALGTDKLQGAKVSDWDSMVDTNVKGLLYLTRLILPHFLKNQRGHVINLGSVAGRWVYPGGAVYCATKFAVRAISDGLRMDLIGTPIRVTNIEPGLVESEFSFVRTQDEKKAKEIYQGMKPLSPMDIADCLMWALDRPAHVNIQELVVFPVDQPAVGQVHRRK